MCMTTIRMRFSLKARVCLFNPLMRGRTGCFCVRTCIVYARVCTEKQASTLTRASKQRQVAHQNCSWGGTLMGKSVIGSTSMGEEPLSTGRRV